jgi:hypothetical protein
MAHRSQVNVPIQCRFLKAPVRWESGVFNPKSGETSYRPIIVEGGHTSTIDPWEFRERFLRLHLCSSADDGQKLLQFLNEVGMWEQVPKALTSGPDLGEVVLDAGYYLYVAPEREFSFFSGTAAYLRDLLLDKTFFQKMYGRVRPQKRRENEKEFLADLDDRFTLEFVWRNHAPCTQVTTLCFWDAVLLSLHIDHLRAAKFRTCSRWDCGIPFAITSGHNKKFCSQYCGHLQSLRKKRGTIQKRGWQGPRKITTNSKRNLQ